MSNIKDSIDYSGQIFGIYTVLEKVLYKNKNSLYSYSCSCGTIKVARIYDIKRGASYCRCLDFKSSEDICIDQLYQRYKHGSKRRGKNIEFSLNKDFFKKLVLANCFYCGKSPINKMTVNKKHSILYNGIDRLDNTHYIDNNCVTCCWECNQAKRDRTLEEFKNWINVVYDNLLLAGK